MTQPTPDVVAESLRAQGFTQEQIDVVVHDMYTAANARVGDSPGKILYSPSRKALAHRVDVGGIYKWAISYQEDGRIEYDAQPDLGWEDGKDITP